MERVIRIFHNNTIDGKLAAELFKKWYLKNSVWPLLIKMYRIEDRNSFPMEDIQPKDFIVLLDYSLSPTRMKKLLAITKFVTWIDNSDKAIRYKDLYEEYVSGIQLKRISTTGLAWLFLDGWHEGALKELQTTSVSPAEVIEVLEKENINKYAPIWVRLINWRYKR